MARLPPLGLDDAPAETASLLRRIEQERGFISVFHATLAHSPGALDAYESLSRHCRLATPLEPELREIVILRIEQHLGNEYEWRRHVPAALRSGVAPEQIAELDSWRESTGFSDRQRAALAVVDDHLARRAVTTRTFDNLRAVFSPDEVIELLLLVGMYLLGAAIILPLDLLADDTAEPASIPLSVPR